MRHLLMFLAVAFVPVAPLHAQAVQEPHCKLARLDHYDCDRDAFLRLLARSRTVRIDTDRMDLFAQREVSKLVTALGKQVAAPEQRPDLVFALAPVDHTGRIDIGPADTGLATLSISDPSKGRGSRSLVWVETLDGQEDSPWPSVVTNVIRQFRSRVETH